MVNFVILSYGTESEYRRAIFSIWSLFCGDYEAKWQYRIILFTDNCEFFREYCSGLSIELVGLTETELQLMKGPDNFLHRAKIGVINQVFDWYPKDTLLYFDSDTFFIKSPSQLLSMLEEGVSIMHKVEYPFSEAVIRYASFGQAHVPSSFLRLIQSKTFLIQGEVVSFTADQLSWNAGVLGLLPAAASLIPDIYSVTDEFFRNTSWFLSEQIAFSLILQAKTKVKASDQWIYHYWQSRQKTFMDSYLPEVIDDKFRQLDLHSKAKVVKTRITQLKYRLEAEKFKQLYFNCVRNRQYKAAARYALHVARFFVLFLVEKRSL